MTEFTFGANSNVGNVRGNNEDSYCADERLGLWLVADGMGGHECGEVASRIAADTVRNCIAEGDDLHSAIQKAHEAILEAVERGEGKREMGTTMVAVHMDGAKYRLAWVGDSRAYLWNGALQQISNDHSLVQMMLDAGNITAEEARTHPRRSIILQYLGESNIKVLKTEELEGELINGQKLILCSDGLSDEMDNNEISAVISRLLEAEGTDQDIADGLIDAILSGTAKDNVTVVVVSLV